MDPLRGWVRTGRGKGRVVIKMVALLVLAHAAIVFLLANGADWLTPGPGDWAASVLRDAGLGQFVGWPVVYKGLDAYSDDSVSLSYLRGLFSMNPTNAAFGLLGFSNPSASSGTGSTPSAVTASFESAPVLPLTNSGLEQNGLPSSLEKPASKISHDLADLLKEYEEYLLQGEGEGFSPSNELLLVDEGWVVIDAIASADAKDLIVALESLGVQGGAAFGAMVSGRLPITAIDSMTQVDSLKFALAAYVATNVGSVTSQGDAAMRADDGRSAFNLDGTGITVGVLSDSFDCQEGAAGDVASGDLPSGISVLQEESGCISGTDEGRAMMQLIHDVAPGASLLFHSAFGGQANFAQGIIDLKEAGADVIVDDVGYFDEPMFQDGIIAQAVDTVVADGVSYFSSAGNGGRDAFQSTFTPGGAFAAGAFSQGAPLAPPFFGGVAHDFGGGDVFQRVTFPAGATMLLSFQWDDPAASVCVGCPGPDSDMDIYLLNDPPTVVLNGGVELNIGVDPVEVFAFTSTVAQSGNIMIVKHSGPDPGLMKYVRFDSSPAITLHEFDTASGTVFGHANAAGAEAVGASRYDRTPEFGQSPPLLESFSSAGPTPILFDTAGNSISSVTRNKPEIVAPDGTDTTFFGGNDFDGTGFPNFSGTSAAAPHAAGVAALMLQGVPSLAPTDIYLALETTAIDMEGPGFDFNSGFGLIDTFQAVLEVDTVAPTDPTPTSGSHTVNVASTDTTVDITWPAVDAANGATDGLSGVDGYSSSFTQGATDLPDQVKDNEAGDLTATSHDLAIGSWFFHLRTVDLAANWSSTVHLGPFVIATTPDTPVGDCNGDGNLNALDITTIELTVVGALTEKPGCDANGDGNINALDITATEFLVAAAP